MKIIPPNRIVSSLLGGSEDYSEKVKFFLAIKK
jgi:hypothetical protein